MLVGERMSKPAITIHEDMAINDALNMMKREHIRRMPVVHDGKLVGIVSDKDLLNASPSPATTLSIWEMNYLLSKITVKDVMTRKVLTVHVNTPIEEAAREMADHKIGGMPVVNDEYHVVGIITETDLFKIFTELMGARERGVRATVIIPDNPGELAAITKAISENGGNFLAFGQFSGGDSSTRMVTFKVAGLSEDKVRSLITPFVSSWMDLRTC